MSEWWKYTITDFLLFSPRTYYRLIERYNEALWPAHLLALGLGLVIIWLLLRPTPWQGRAISVVLGLLWAWVAVEYLWRRYATINWAATYFGWAFLIESLLLAGIGGLRGGLAFRARRTAPAITGVGLFLFALLLYPLVALLGGRGWQQAEVFGLSPDPTVIGTLGLLLLTDGALRRWLLAVPLLWCLVSGATFWALASPGGLGD
jgi:Family of unknown function (DUF6064)